MSLTLLELFRSVFQWFLFDPYLDFGRGGMVGLMGDLRGLREGFIVVFVASEKQQILKAQSLTGGRAPVLPPAEDAL